MDISMSSREKQQRDRPAAKSKRGREDDDSSFDLLDELTWDVAAINNHLENIRRVWAKILGISGPQWLILMAISELDQGNGISVTDVSGKLSVHSTFVTAQTKLLEKTSLVIRRGSPVDARIVLLSLTDKARRQIEQISIQRTSIADSIFGDVSNAKLREFVGTLALFKRRVERAARQLELDKNHSE
jgi:DNA-binding MarR family transcriptional regulator